MKNDAIRKNAKKHFMQELGSGVLLLRSDSSLDCEGCSDYCEDIIKKTSSFVVFILDRIRDDLLSEKENAEEIFSVNSRTPGLQKKISWLGINLSVIDVIREYLEDPSFVFMITGGDSVRCIDTSLGVEVVAFPIPSRDYLSEEDAELLGEIFCGIEDAMTNEHDDGDKVHELDFE